MPSTTNSTIGLLVSVRSAAEAMRALEGGAALIDIKEPLHGSLGRADDAVIQEVVREVNGARPVSAALGEWVDAPADPANMPGLSFVKWGLAGCARRTDWQPHLAKLLRRRELPQVVLTAYADWECAQGPSVEEVFALCREQPGSVMLIDTHCKDGKRTLLDWLPVAWIEDWCARCREAQVRIALAGSLGLTEIHHLLPARPDWFAVRGAVCDDGDRDAAVQTDKVRRLVSAIRPHLKIEPAGVLTRIIHFSE